MMENIYLAIGGLLTAAGTAWVTFIFTKAKYKQEVEMLKVEVSKAKTDVESGNIDNDIKLSNYYKDLLDDLDKRYETKFSSYVSMTEDKMKMMESLFNQKIALLQEEIKLKDKKIKLQQEEIIELKKENKTLKLSRTRGSKSNA